MLKTLWNSISPPKSAAPEEAAVFDRRKLKLLFEHFPIGKKLRYYPEYLRDIVLHTIIIAYRVNGHFLYAHDAVLLDDEGYPHGFLLAGDKILATEKVKTFQLLVPDTTEMELKLDYFTRAELGRAGQFRHGNVITLLTDSKGRGIPTVDTKVERRQVMNEGPYEDSSTIIVTPDLDSLTVADKRRKQRVETSIKADLYLGADAPSVPCILGDFSERFLRLRIADPAAIMPPMEPEERVVVEFDLGESSSLPCRFRGKVFRRVNDFCVIQIDQIFKYGEFQKINMMDIVEIKTGLLNQRS